MKFSISEYSLETLDVEGNPLGLESVFSHNFQDALSQGSVGMGYSGRVKEANKIRNFK